MVISDHDHDHDDDDIDSHEMMTMTMTRTMMMVVAATKEQQRAGRRHWLHLYIEAHLDGIGTCVCHQPMRIQIHHIMNRQIGDGFGDR